MAHFCERLIDFDFFGVQLRGLIDQLKQGPYAIKFFSYF